jgi:predicted HTH transcriptional regulator
VELWFCRRYPKLAEAQGVMAEVKEKYKNHLARCEMIMSKPPEYWLSSPVLKLIAQGEGAQLEFKETLEADAKTGEKNPGVLHGALKTIAAFLNTDGGALLIGVDDSGEIKGLDRDFKFCKKHDRDGLEQKLRDLLNTRFTPPPLGLVDVSFEQLPTGHVCRVDIKRSDSITHLDGKEVYIRDGNTTRKLEGPALTSWIQERMRQSS